MCVCIFGAKNWCVTGDYTLINDFVAFFFPEAMCFSCHFSYEPVENYIYLMAGETSEEELEGKESNAHKINIL